MSFVKVVQTDSPLVVEHRINDVLRAYDNAVVKSITYYEREEVREFDNGMIRGEKKVVVCTAIILFEGDL